MDNLSNINKLGWFAGANPIMIIGSAFLVVLFVLFTVLDPDLANEWYTAAKDYISSYWAWFYVTIMTGFLFFSFWYFICWHFGHAACLYIS